jgi:Tfp pilus assembly protein PilO
MPRIFIIISCIFLTFILGVFLIWPKYQELEALKLKIFQKQLEFQSQEEYLTDLKNASQELEKYQESLSKIDSALPEDASLPALFDFFQKASSQSGLVLGNFGSVTISPKEESTLKEIRLALSLSGSYSALKDFLSILENSARMVEVENISFSSPSEKEPFFFKLGIKVYSY